MKDLDTIIDEDGDVIIKFDYGSYILAFDEDDSYLSLSFPSFYEVETYSKKIEVMNICDDINKSIKAVKLFLYKDDVHASVELFYPNEKEIENLLKRTIRVIRTALSKFYEEVGKLNDGE
ncbi:hypothetical protein JKP27_22655 [Vibrio vulnificus]|nr:hypothetical protein [Vibrio vulnificus]